MGRTGYRPRPGRTRPAGSTAADEPAHAVGLGGLVEAGRTRIAKAVTSAAANAEDKSGGTADLDALVIKTIMVDGGRVNKRFMPRAMGRANRINKRSSHLTVVVSDEE